MELKVNFIEALALGNPLTNYLHPDKQFEVLILRNPFVLDVDS